MDRDEFFKRLDTVVYPSRFATQVVALLDGTRINSFEQVTRVEWEIAQRCVDVFSPYFVLNSFEGLNVHHEAVIYKGIFLHVCAVMERTDDLLERYYFIGTIK